MSDMPPGRPRPKIPPVVSPAAQNPGIGMPLRSRSRASELTARPPSVMCTYTASRPQ